MIFFFQVFQVILYATNSGSSLQDLGFQGYLQYCNGCLVYFVIQLLSEPDK